MTYYIPVAKQIAQLADQGFGEIEAYDFEGVPVTGASEHSWIFYLARKLPAKPS
jgi:hypothetical protein